MRSRRRRPLACPRDGLAVIITADDLGLSHEVNDAVRRAFEEGLITHALSWQTWPASTRPATKPRSEESRPGSANGGQRRSRAVSQP
jgi:YdjC-like protein